MPAARHRRPPPSRTTTVAAPARHAKPRSHTDALAALRARVAAAKPGTPKRRWSSALRELVACAFVADREQRPLAFHAAQVADLVSRKCVEAWSAKGRWVERRAAYFEQVRADALRTLGSDHARQLADDLISLDALQARLAEQLRNDDGAVPPVFGSRAEAFRLLLLIDQRRDEKRGVLESITSAGRQPPRVTPTFMIRPPIARAMARAALVAEHTDIASGDS